MAKRQCLSIKELAVTGTDLIADGMQPGKAIGETLKQLLEYVLEHPEDNTKEKLMEQVHNIASLTYDELTRQESICSLIADSSYGGDFHVYQAGTDSRTI